MWLENSPGQSVQHLLEQIGTRRIILNCDYRLNSTQTEHLVKLAFSSDPGVTAGARLDLNAKLDRRLFSKINEDVGTALDVAFSEALLSQSEILYTVFPQAGRSDQHLCLACNTEVALDATVYHRRCATIEWLTKHARFKYDLTTGLLEPKELIYISPDARARLIKILRYHAQLSVDIVHKTADKTIYWSRQEDDSLRATNVRTSPREDIPGTHQWMIAHGYQVKK